MAATPQPHELPPPTQQQAPAHAGGGAGVEAESPWRRDEVTYLLHAWRDVAADSSSTSESPALPKSDSDQRIFDKFCGFYGDAATDSVRRTLKSLKKTKKSLLRSFRFIAVFNQNHVIAKSMSSFGGSNWFALREGEQRRIVQAHYKRKPFAYIDEDMFDAIEMIQETESRALMTSHEQSVPPESGSGASIKSEPTPYLEDKEPLYRADAGFGRSEFDSEPPVRARKQQKAPSPSPSPPASAIANRFSMSWKREDNLMLLRAWEECLDDPRAADESIAVFDNRVYERFQELGGGGNAMRSALAVRLKKYSLIPTYQFIKDFDSGKILPIGDGLAKQINTWFGSSRKYRTAVVQKYYTKSHYAHIEPDMMPIIERIMKKTKHVESHKSTATPSSLTGESDVELVESSTSFDEFNAGFEDAARVPWTRHETSLLLNAWRFAETLIREDPYASETMGDVDAFIYKRFVIHCGGESSRDEADVAAQKRALVNTFHLISAFNNRECKGNASVEEGWFSLRKGERNRIILQAERACTDIDEYTYNELRWILKYKSQPSGAGSYQAPPLPRRAPVPVPVVIKPLPSPTLTADQQSAMHQGFNRSVTVWNRDEVLHLLQAWTEILEGPCPSNESLSALNDRIYDRFLTFVGGTTMRTVKALHAKRDSVIASYYFITDFNKSKKTIATNGGGSVAWGANDWFALSHEEQKNLVKAHYKKASFSYLYSDMLPIVKKIIGTAPKVEVPEPGAGGLTLRKPRPNSYSPEELDAFLQAWYEAVHENPRQESETANAFNARLHKRFKQLCGGKTKKPEVSLLTKRRVLTSTYEFIAEFNRKHTWSGGGEKVQADWFQLSKVERQKKMMSANKVVHTCTNIDEDTFKALDRILGSGSANGAGASAVGRPAATSSHSAGQVPSSAVSTEGNRSKHTPTATTFEPRPAPMKRKFTQPPTVTSSRQTRSRAEPQAAPANYYSPSASNAADHALKKQKVEAELSAIAGLFETQTQHLMSLLHQIQEDRKVEYAERKQLLEKIQSDQEERQRDREERALERERTQKDWEAYREERKVEREQDRLLLIQALGLQPPIVVPAVEKEDPEPADSQETEVEGDSKSEPPTQETEPAVSSQETEPEELPKDAETS
ncbi:hypothetical protein Gpo141_00002882 [Globisporangium polare]